MPPCTIADDERFKGGIHGLLLGCTLPVLAFNVIRRRPFNVAVYTALVAFEIWHITKHLQCAAREPTNA